MRENFKINNPFVYFGGKKASAKFYPHPLPEITHIVEPFAGGIGFSRYWLETRDFEIVCTESDRAVVDAWNLLLSATPEWLKEKVEGLLEREAPYTNADFLRDYPDDPSFYALVSLISKIGGRRCLPEKRKPNSCIFKGDNTRKIMSQYLKQSQHFANLPYSIKSKFKIDCKDYSEIEIHPDSYVFIDPPYQSYPDGYAEFWTREKHEKLKLWIEDIIARRACKQLVVCGSEECDWFPLPIKLEREGNNAITNARRRPADPERYFYWERDERA